MLKRLWNLCHGKITDTEQANKVAKNIRSIFINSDESEDWEDVAKIYRSCTGYTLTAVEAREKFKIDSNPLGNPYYKAACICWEYMQFKKTVFKCDKVEYDETTGKISKIKFSFVTIR